MKRILTSALAIVLFIGVAQAQTTATEKSDRRGHGKEMMKDLNLTDAQKTQLKSIHDAEKKEMDALKAGGSVTPEQRKGLHQKYRSQLDAVLTPEQREQMKARMPKGMSDSSRRGGRGFDRKGEGLGKAAPFHNKALNLTADQQTKLKGYSDDFRNKAKDVHSNTALTDEQKKEKLHTLSKQYMEQSKAVLTADQLKTLEEMRGKRKGRGNINV